MGLGKIPVPSTFLCSQLRGHPSLSSPGLLHLLHPCHEPWKVIALNSQPSRDNRIHPEVQGGGSKSQLCWQLPQGKAARDNQEVPRMGSSTRSILSRVSVCSIPWRC